MNLITIEKRKGFNQEANALSHQCQTLLNIDVNCRLINGYGVSALNDAMLDEAIKQVFSEPMVDEVSINPRFDVKTSVAREPLPGQYDQRADSAEQCLRLLDSTNQSTVTTFQVVLFDRPLTADERKRFIHYWINPVEMREKQFDEPEMQTVPEAEIELNGFIHWSKAQCEAFIQQQGAAMRIEDFELIQSYFKEHVKRDLTVTEFKVLDTYWSDHCRHTTFESAIDEITITEGPLSIRYQSALDALMQERIELKRNDRPITLMEMATHMARVIRDPRVEDSDEINACSVVVDVTTDEGIEPWLLMFKNETHNHPTEIEPFGGASTCIGGAIRDPLSGRSFVYQAMRISACGNVKETLAETLQDKLPQRIIAQKASLGNASYGNQIGVPTSFVQEIYHPSYVAKHLECGAVVGAVPQAQVKRLKPDAGDLILLVGGKTGRDGIGGATGSSKIHTEHSLHTAGSEVQKGNAPEERKLQRYYNNPLVASRIKKSNDFGAGGVAVAIGELAPGLIIYLDRIPTKYKGLNPTELAISESQERMAIVADKEDVSELIRLAEAENLEATIVAEVSERVHLVMQYKDRVVVDLPRALLDTNGVRPHVSAELTHSTRKQDSLTFNENNLIRQLSDLNSTSQKGLVEQFDASITATTILFPFGGKTQWTPSIASVHKVFHPSKDTHTASILAYGFIPELNEQNVFVGAQAAVLESIAKSIAVGGKISELFFSFQEYFPRLYEDSQKWGQVVLALLGAQSVQRVFKRPAIGGKDSMSGSFKDLDVLETLISFACSTTPMDKVMDNVAKAVGNKLYLLDADYHADGSFNLEAMLEKYQLLENLIQDRHVTAVHSCRKGIAVSALEMVFGNDLGLQIDTSLDVLTSRPCALLIESNAELEHDSFIPIGQITKHGYRILDLGLDVNRIQHVYQTGLDFLYPTHAQAVNQNIPTITSSKPFAPYAGPTVDVVNVVIPVFPGTNCEYDTAKAFVKAGAEVSEIVIRNQTSEQLNDSIIELAKAIGQGHILALAGGFSAGDEPDGSAKFIVNILRNPKIKEAVEHLRKRDGLIIGICNGFQALIKSGYLPYGELRDLQANDATLAHNTIHRHLSAMVRIRQSSIASPWLDQSQLGAVHRVPISHGEGRLVMSNEQFKDCVEKGQIAYQYVDDQDKATMDVQYNLNGSDYAIEALISEDGRILGKMGHTERIQTGCYVNIDDMEIQTLFENGVRHFKGEH